MNKLTKKPQIGTLREKSLHSNLKKWFEKPGDVFEVPHEGYVIDIIRGKQLIEIQTGNFSSFKNKIKNLSKNNLVQIIFPIPESKWIVKVNSEGNEISRRKSPKRGKIEDVFSQLMYIPNEIIHPNVSMIVLMIHVNEIWVDDGKGSWRRKYWSKLDYELLCVKKQYTFIDLLDYQNLISPKIKNIFTSSDVSKNNNITKKQAQKMCYSLRKMQAIKIVGKIGNSNIYEKYLLP